ncbi:glycosyltransferase [Candidatus Saganbacteria bacterium]|nr:glycosyltransferase [Candidatus Saganbacteria bacterium]
MSTLNNKTAQKVKEFYNENCKRVNAGKARNAAYYDGLKKFLRSVVLPGQKVLDLGCGNGDLLASLTVLEGVGIDLSEKMIETAQNRHSSSALRFMAGNAQDTALLRSLKTRFDVVILCNSITEMHDVQAVFEALHVVCHAKTRIIVLSYSRIWQMPLRLAEKFGLKTKNPVNNWLSSDIVREMISMSDFEVVRSLNFQIMPFNLGPISRFVNRYIGNLPIINELTLMFGIIARPTKSEYVSESIPSCSIVIPCRNEAGHIEKLANRLPDLGAASEVLWVEGNSTDNTAEKIKEIISVNPEKNWKFLKQPGKGKGDAVRCAFAQARGDILIILDADVTVNPEDIPKFIDLMARNKAEFINGCRLIYPMDEKAMRFLNLLGNRFFAKLFTYLLGQKIRDTLCGTKALWRNDYEKIASNRNYFGDFDPFGDFDLLFGAARLNLKIADLPIRYGERTYGTTNISRFRDGLLLLKMSAYAAKKLRFI